MIKLILLGLELDGQSFNLGSYSGDSNIIFFFQFSMSTNKAFRMVRVSFIEVVCS